MNKAELLKKAAGIVQTLIKSKAPQVEDLSLAHAELGKIVETAKSLEPGNPVPADVATGVNAVIERMESFRSGYCSNDPTQVITMKSFTLGDFAEFVQTEVNGALAEKTPAKTLKRLHTLDRQIAKAGEAGAAIPGLNKAASLEDTTTVSVPMYTDPAQITPTDTTSSAAAAQSGTPTGNNFESSAGGSAPAAGNAANGSATSQGSGTPGASNYAANKGETPAAPAVVPAVVAPETVLNTVAETVEKATKKDEFKGWPLDMNAGRKSRR